MDTAVKSMWNQLTEVETGKVFFKFCGWTNARNCLNKMGFKSTVHYCNDGGQKWIYKGREFSLHGI